MLKATLLFIALALTFTSATDFALTNNCATNIVVHSDTSAGTGPIGPDGVTLAPGQSAPLSAADWTGTMYLTNPGGTIAEFSLNSGGAGLDFFDLSLINGFDMGVQIAPSDGCPGSICTTTPCTDAYMLPTDDFATRSCPAGTSYQITYCPAG